MLIDYLKENFENGEPIFLSEVPGTSPAAVRQEMKKLTDEGKLHRFSNGVYYLPYRTAIGAEGTIGVDSYIEKKYLHDKDNAFGYFTGYELANYWGLTTQVPAWTEVRSNRATTSRRMLKIEGRTIVVYKPFVPITNDNVTSLQFLDLMLDLDKYCEFSGQQRKELIQRTLSLLKPTQVKECLAYYPDRVFRVLYREGLLDVLV